MKKKDESNFIAKSFATLEYMALSKAIGSSEKADVRYWSTIPQSIHWDSFNLKKGEYSVEVMVLDETLFSQNIVVENSKSGPILIYHRHN